VKAREEFASASIWSSIGDDHYGRARLSGAVSAKINRDGIEAREKRTGVRDGENGRLTSIRWGDGGGAGERAFSVTKPLGS
jgi:hypothetical protein